jgi:hypothetical protein
MTKAKTRVSTRRRTASKIVQFPKSKRPLPADRPSAIASVKRSGLRLIDDDATGEPATHDQLAVMEFEPWPGKSEDTEALTMRQRPKETNYSLRVSERCMRS